ncbi:hypothetical protein GCM10010174_29610 [Kutzneria viridogrisea]|uniref:GH16 domain-containing protein n=1 Tax=Kutzneria viridogrisea TaxID=47990 RepID=A0ABR6BC48_9PSEU|nr:hypothetical protein [Kutzneria viridogrisea]
MTRITHRHAAVGAVVAVAVFALGAVNAVGAPSEVPTDNACANPVLAHDLSGWGPFDGAVVSRDTVGDHPVANLHGSGTARVAAGWYGASGNYLGQSEGPAVPLPASTATGESWTRTACGYRLGGGTSTTTPPTDSRASDRYHWGAANPEESDEFNAGSVDLAKWGLFGASEGQSTGCSPGFNGHGQRCASQTTEGGGLLSVVGTADGVTGGLYSNHNGFKYGRVEVRERAIPLADNGGAAYHAVPLLFPVTADYPQAEIDFAERDVADPGVDLFVHHHGTQEHCAATVDSTRFHNYAVDWEPDSVTWYVDAEQVCRVEASIDYFDKSNGGAQLDMFPDTGTLMRPAREDVDWIHMYPSPSTVYGP